MPDLARLSGGIVAAYVSHNPVSVSDLSRLIRDVHAALRDLEEPPKPLIEVLKPAVPARRSVTDNHIVCLEDGKKFKSLKRHLSTHHDLTPEQYRTKWGLPGDYPMVAPAYAALRSTLAKGIGLGQKHAKRGRRK